MKKIVPVIVKSILAALFLYNIGILSLISFISHMEPQKSPPEKADNGREDIRYLNEKVRHARDLGENYTPQLYFADLAEIELRKKKNDFDRYVVISVNYSISEMHVFLDENIRHHRIYDSGEDYDKFMQGFTIAQEKCLEITDPGHKKREAEFQAKVNRPGYWSDLFLGLLVWLGRFYLKNFLLAFILLWVWWYQEKNKIMINNPLSFLICLIFYPITIPRVWIKSWHLGMRVWAMEIEFKRRQTDIFSLISADEMADIKRFAQSDWKISKYRDYLNSRGLIRRQALVPIATITLLFLIIPKTSSSGATYTSADVVKYHLEVHAPPGLSGERSNHHDDQTTTPAIIFFDQFIFHLFFAPRIIFLPAPQGRAGFKTNPDPVPLFY